jgi:hypothetical protein
MMLHYLSFRLRLKSFFACKKGELVALSYSYIHLTSHSHSYTSLLPAKIEKNIFKLSELVIVFGNPRGSISLIYDTILRGIDYFPGFHGGERGERAEQSRAEQR